MPYTPMLNGYSVEGTLQRAIQRGLCREISLGEKYPVFRLSIKRTFLPRGYGPANC